MTSPQGGGWVNPPWPPSPELLAAYFDGEFEGRDDLEPLRRRLEEWLARNPRGCAELGEYRRLRRLWLETTPPDPPPASWRLVQSHLENRGTGTGAADFSSSRPSLRTPWKTTGFLVAAACLLLAVIRFKEFAGPPLDDKPFPVASEREVVILHVDGADTSTLVVGALPVEGPLELAGLGDVTLTSVEPADRDNMVPEIHIDGPGRPIIWARAEAEED
jgi:hypothetical protein